MYKEIFYEWSQVSKRVEEDWVSATCSNWYVLKGENDSVRMAAAVFPGNRIESAIKVKETLLQLNVLLRMNL